MRTEAVRAQLAARGLGDRYREFTVSSATVALETVNSITRSSSPSGRRYSFTD